jgi:UDP-N-acetylmuramoylalanine--D-glutamate ligase
MGCRHVPAGPYDLVVVSPGVSPAAPLMAEADRLGVPVIGELELGWSRWRGRTLAVTGSNGKSTMVKLCHDSLKRAGRSAVIAGNYGPPACDAALGARADWLVLEVSSFQLERARALRPDVGVLLNVHPNHLDRHGTMESYAAIKARLFDRIERREARIVHDEALSACGSLRTASPGCTTFGAGATADFRYAAGDVTWNEAGPARTANGTLDVCRGRSICVAQTVFGNDVLGLTAAAAAAAMCACGVDPRCVTDAAQSFEPLPHRMQEQGAARGVRFVDNSKATNLAALAASLRMIDGPVRLIAGGLLKEGALESVRPALGGRVRAAYLIGKAGPAMAEAWQSDVPCRLCGGLEEAVDRAWREAAPGDVVLLAPGCASFDQFRNFEDRGNVFCGLVERIKEKEQRETV